MAMLWLAYRPIVPFVGTSDWFNLAAMKCDMVNGEQD
jgi:hypothetical protein